MIETTTEKEVGLTSLAAVSVWPPAIEQADDDIPAQQQAVLQEAMNCFAIKAWRASCILARNTIEATVRDLGGNGGDLKKRIQNLGESGKLLPGIVEFADQVRILGNDAAHGPDAVTQTDAEDAIEFCKHLFDDLYVKPARLRRQQAKRQLK